MIDNTGDEGYHPTLVRSWGPKNKYSNEKNKKRGEKSKDMMLEHKRMLSTK